ncbi:MAG TPA: fatty acid desaturase [Acidimicrobiia bacterium]|nr:fatty acid desaturase [Acidimicrobiia bacterium]
MPVLFSLLVAVLVAVVVTQATIAITTVYLHRALSHRALTLSPVVAVPMRSFLWLTTGMRPREWVAVHRKHHAATDTEDDPHSPIVHGFWRVQLGNVGLYRKVASDPTSVRKYARDLPPDAIDRMLFDHAFFGLAVGITLLVVTMRALGFPLWVGFLASGIHAVAYVMLSASINAVGHQYGDRPYANSATNSQALALVTGGEGLHNNHHAAPTSARFSLHRGELDPGWWLVRALVALRLAHVRHDDVKLKPAA